ncbi:MAG TPA: PQQ-binding-like beta-propeller repeat protein [Rhizomicrobium sp.]|nr:PQQ-binding-like beta-propeller repeat protein [Rhizomicrobium sp.]
MNFRTLRILAPLLAASLLLSGCSTFDFMDSWFTGTSKSKLKGERIAVMTAEESLRADPGLSSVKVVLPRPYVNSEWPNPGGYAANAMYHLMAPGPLRKIWTADAGKGSSSASRLTAPPVMGGGRVFVLDAAATVYAFDANNGTLLWSKPLAPKGGEATFWNDASLGLLGKSNATDPTKGFGGGIAYENGRLFASTGFGEVVALSAQNGGRLWTNKLGVPIVNAPVVNGGRLFISSGDNHFVALAQSDGRKLWDHQGISESAGILSSTSAAVAGEFVIVPYTSGELYAIRVQNGRPAWNDMLTRSGQVTALSELDDIAGRPVVDRDMVFAISHSGVMAAISLSTGERIWSRDIAGIQTPWAAGDFVYVVTIDAQVICLQRKDGRVKWITQLDRWQNPDEKAGAVIWAGPVLVSNRLIVVSNTGVIASVSPYTGKVLGTEEFDGGSMIAPIVANDTLYLLTKHAELLALK